MTITPLDAWVHNITGDDIQKYRLKQINATLRLAQKSQYYRMSLPERIESMSQFESLPTIDAGTLTRAGAQLACAPHSEIARIVTLMTSGSTDTPKRVFFSEHDLELTVDYFANGLRELASRGDVMAILLPCERPDGVGDLIARALMRIPVKPVRHGLVGSLAACVADLKNSNARSLVGTPVQTLAAARYCAARDIRLNIDAVLLSTDNIPRIIVSELNKTWGCEVFEHYGMTEMGLGGAIDCRAHNGYHIRENDLFVEILDDNGRAVAEGEYGEVVITTLTREAMPLIRYRTGDISKLMKDECVCGSRLRRLAPLRGRIGGDVKMACGALVRIIEFDEVLFGITKVSGYTIKALCDDNLLEINLESQESVGAADTGHVMELLNSSGLIQDLEIRISTTLLPDVLPPVNGKRTVSSVISGE